MKKVGIVTFHRSHNCGSILQSFAMQEILKTYGYEPEFIDFSTKGQKELYSIFRPLRFNTPRNLAKTLYKNGLGLILFNRAKGNWASYDKYLSKHLSLSKQSYQINSELNETTMNYDAYLTGSDQVWNVTIDDYDAAYFLNFVKKSPKIAYAVSQGAKDIRKYTNDSKGVARYIRDIDFVSTREENGQKWLNQLTDQTYPVVLDPTLLHTQDAYSKIEEPHKVPGIKNNQYIFVYATPLSWSFINKINAYAKLNNLEVVIWHSDIWLKRLGWLRGIKCPRNQNPGKYLDLIKNAKFVCTSSFHGVVFSTIYRKNFVVLENEGMLAGDDDRMTGFLKRLKLSDRIVSLTSFNNVISRSVNYADFKKELKKQQEVSHNFLKSALKTKSSTK